MNPPLEIAGLDHVVIRANDAEATVGFYRDVLGCPVERSLDAGLIQLRAGHSLIDIVPVASHIGAAGGAGPGGEGRNMDHFCLRLTRFDAEALRAHLAGHGIEMGEVAERYGATGNGPSVYLQDPDGNTVELKGDG